jgi:hypothetical protein
VRISLAWQEESMKLVDAMLVSVSVAMVAVLIQQGFSVEELLYRLKFVLLL